MSLYKESSLCTFLKVQGGDAWQPAINANIVGRAAEFCLHDGAEDVCGCGVLEWPKVLTGNAIAFAGASWVHDPLSHRLGQL